MRISKFIKDLFLTGFSQIAVVLFGMLVLKIMAVLLSKEYFGLFILVRRWVAVLLPIITLNISIGLARYVSFEEEKARTFLHISLITITILSTIIFIFLSLFNKIFSELLFNDRAFFLFVFLLIFFLFANVIHLIAYSYFRGKQNMNRANTMRTLFYGFPVLLGLIFLVVNMKDPVGILYLYFLIYSGAGSLLGFFYLKKEFSLKIVTGLLKNRIIYSLKSNRKVFSFSLIRIPSVFFNSLIFGFPVFIASHKISLIAAGYIGIVVAVLHFLELFSMPFNMIFLPKFASLKRKGDSRIIKESSQVLLNFVFTFLPVLAAIVFGLSGFIVRIWFGPKYLSTVNSVAAVVIFSIFYLGYALIRGVLDGLYVFPFNNIICFLGFVTIAILSILFGSDVFRLSLAFGIGLLVLGVISIRILVKKLKLLISWLTILKFLVISSFLLFLLKYLDNFFISLNFKYVPSMVACLLVRCLLVSAVWIFLWRKELWYIELIKRISFKKG
jgi:O-antigen/teichoic acid export membrane protein